MLAMSEQEKSSKIQSIVAAQLKSESVCVTLEANLAKDLGADSLDLVELIMALESAFDIEIPVQESEKIPTVQQAVDYISQKKVLVWVLLMVSLESKRVVVTGMGAITPLGNTVTGILERAPRGAQWHWTHYLL